MTRVLRAVAVASVLALLGLLVWDLAHQGGPTVASSVDRGKPVVAPKLDYPRLNGGSGNLTPLEGASPDSFPGSIGIEGNEGTVGTPKPG